MVGEESWQSMAHLVSPSGNSLA